MISQAGVYTITCLPTGKVYIGSTTRSFKRRFVEHRRFLQLGMHPSRHLQHAWTKHGSSVFEFKPIIACRPEDALLYEQLAIDALSPELNLSPTANNCVGVKHSDEFKAKCAERMRKEYASGERKEPLSAFHNTPGARRLLSAGKAAAWAAGKYTNRKSRAAAEQAKARRFDVEDGRELTTLQIAAVAGVTVGAVNLRVRRGVRGAALLLSAQRQGK